MYGERSSERVNVRVVLHIRQTLPNHRRRTTGSGYQGLGTRLCGVVARPFGTHVWGGAAIYMFIHSSLSGYVMCRKRYETMKGLT